MRMALRGVFWVCLYAAVAVAPLAIAAVETGAGGRSWITAFSVALGFIGVVGLALAHAVGWTTTWPGPGSGLPGSR
jgi:hypothetical protein